MPPPGRPSQRTSTTCRGDPTDPESLSVSKPTSPLETGGGAANRLYYLATPPHVYADVVQRLGAAGMVDRRRGWRAVIIEKPFGPIWPRPRSSTACCTRCSTRTRSTASITTWARRRCRTSWSSASPTASSSRSGTATTSTTCRSPWPRPSASSTAAATTTGSASLRDMFQNHLLQLLALAAMEPPASFEAESLRNESVKVLRAVRPFEPQDVARDTLSGQYDGYRQEPGVAPPRTRRPSPPCAVHRQLALAGSALLPALGQEPGEPRPRRSSSSSSPSRT